MENTKGIRPGNLLSYQNDNGEWFYGTVVKVRSTFVILEVEREEQEPIIKRITTPEIMGVGLYEKILAKLGFKGSDQDGYSLDGVHIHRVETNKGNSHLETPTQQRLDFVHQLQNLYIDTTGKSLQLP